MSKLIIARHGNTFGPNDIIRRVGKTDLPLVESGILQATRIGSYLQMQGLIPDVIYTSQLQRTKQTAELIQVALGKEIPTHSLDIFNEVDYGLDENQAESLVKARVGEEALKAWEEHATPPPGWNFDADNCIANWYNFASHVEKNYQDKTVLVVTSNGIARFSPYLTGNFEAFKAKYPIKIATGALCLFEKPKADPHWHCLVWNEKPKQTEAAGS